MKLNAILILTLFLGGTSYYCKAQKGYMGTMVTKFGDTLTGFIIFKMDKPNDELIEITTTSNLSTTQEKGSSTKTKSSSGSRINTAIINYIKVNDSIYYFRDIKAINQTSKYNRNMCLRLTTGSLKNGIFQIGNSNEPEKAVISLPGANNTYLVSPQDDYYAQTGTWSLLQYSDCLSLKKKISEKQTGYSWNNTMPLPERLALWRNWILEYESCTQQKGK